jgi:nucleoside 2-deoxyribosyltransferase
MKIFIAHASSFPYEEKLYAPIRASELARTHEFILPEEQKYNGTWNTKDAIKSCDVMIADVSAPSTGAGIELGWADAAGTPIIAIYEKGSTPSTVIRYLTQTVIEYENQVDLLIKIEEALSKIEM